MTRSSSNNNKYVFQQHASPFQTLKSSCSFCLTHRGREEEYPLPPLHFPYSRYISIAHYVLGTALRNVHIYISSFNPQENPYDIMIIDEKTEVHRGT